ncbi:MAG: hypothetical protein H6837_01780 [Planctomycetes bacterium]|nr:hypothetical protein [Planctomycetota bacterium]
MDAALRRLTPLLLAALALLVWFEERLFGRQVGMVRLTVGLLCIYTLLLVLERQRLDQRFTELLANFRRYFEERGGARETVDPRKQIEAATILAAALHSTDPTVRDTAASNLKRLTGKDFGADPVAWQRWIAEFRSQVERPEDPSPGGSNP